MKRFKLFLALFAFASTICFTFADTNFFPIMAWNHAPNDSAVLKKMRDCGLTVAGFVATGALDACHAAGLKAIVSDNRSANYDWTKVDDAIARSNITSLVAQVGKHPAVYGYYLRDEPNSSFFPGLAKVAARIHELDPGKWAYINLFPNYANAGQIGAASYDEYVEKFIATCKPTVLSYDNYSLMDNGTLRDGYWANLDSMRNAAVKHKLPFWNIVLSVAHFNYPNPPPPICIFRFIRPSLTAGKALLTFVISRRRLAIIAARLSISSATKQRRGNGCKT